jgi:hypothetical protein
MDWIRLAEDLNSCRNGNKPFDFIKGIEYGNMLSDSYRHGKDCASLN